MTEATIETLMFPRDVERWHYVRSFLDVREDVFVRDLGWSLHVMPEGGEFEQYDTFRAIYVIAHLAGEVVGGGRLLRTSHRSGIYTYMIKDACDGKLEGMPSNLCYDEPPVSDGVWELTRFFSTGENDVTLRLLNAAFSFLKQSEANACLMLGSPAFPRRARRLGFNLGELGPIVENEDCRFQAFECSIS